MKKFLLLSTSLTACSFFAAHAFANPENGVVAAGSATIQTGVSRVDVLQTSDRAVIDWRSFNIEKNETTQFHHPSSSSLTVNRINDSNPSHILGNLTANGNVVLINQAGISFGKDSVVDVNSLVATTSDISNANAMAGNLSFQGIGSSTGTIKNDGTITAREAGLVGLVAPRVENNGVINAKLGKVHMASGDRFTLDLYGDGTLTIAASDDLQNQLVSNKGRIDAAGGIVTLTAAAGANLVSSIVELDGEINAPSASEQNGKIVISGNDDTSVSITGSLNADGETGGEINVYAKNIVQQGRISANGTNGNGGKIDIGYANAYLDTETSSLNAKSVSGSGGEIKVIGKANSHAFVSGQYNVSSTSAKGGKVNITAKAGDLKLYGAKVTANGATGGGTINIGGEFQGGGALDHAKTTSINYATILSADATGNGNGGNVTVWSDEETKFAGSAYARGGLNGGNGGQIEISSKDTLKIVGNVTTSAEARMSGYLAGNLLLDPKNITIANGGLTGGGLSYFEFVDPNADAGEFGDNILVLSNGNVAVSDSEDDLFGTDTGAVYLFNGATGALISTLTGSQNNDLVGLYGFTELTNGNYVINSGYWNNGAVSRAGAITWASGSLGINGLVSATNSLVGTSANDEIGSYGIYALENGNYLVDSHMWNNGAATDAGAVTWANGNTGITGAVSAANSLVGTTADDAVGYYGIKLLGNGNAVVFSPFWDNGGADDAGAVTFINGTTGISGAISSANSMIGSTSGDMIGTYDYDLSVKVLSNGDYLFGSYTWDNGGISNAGAVTWGSGSTGSVGVVSAANSLVGSSNNDHVGYGVGGWFDVVEVANGNYVIMSEVWDNGAISNAGASTWVNGATGITGTISAANSLVGSSANDYVGTAYALGNGNYIVSSTNFTSAGNYAAGAVTWVNGTTGITGTISAANSLVGSSAFDQIGLWNLKILSNGNYVVGSQFWDNGAVANAGAATWGDGTTGVVGTISAANSLIGTQTNDQVGGNTVELANGNYIVSSIWWDNGGVSNAGATTWGNGNTGVTGVVSAANSLVGTQVNDYVGNYVTALTNGNYLVSSPDWDNGGIINAGAATWGNGVTGTIGAVSTSNSLYGTQANDTIGYGAMALANGNYVISSIFWDNGSATDAGAVTWGDGTTGTVGAVSISNSIVGSSNNDKVGDSLYDLNNGNYLVGSQNWDNGAIADVGAVTWGNGSGGTVGAVSSANSFVGQSASDSIGDYTIFTLSNGGYIIYSTMIDTGALTDISALTYGGPSGVTGVIDSSNTIFAMSSGDYFYLAGEDTVNNRYVFSNNGAQHAYSISLTGGGSLSSYDSYSDYASSNISLDPTFIANVLNAGTSVTLQANNDITLSDDLIVNNVGGNGGTLTFQAGRSILLNADIFTDDGNLNIFANEDLATGVVNAHRDAGNAEITMGLGSSINTGSGNVNIRLDDGTGKTNSGAGDITLRDITADTIFARNMNLTGDVIIQSGVLTATGNGNSLTLVSGRNFLNYSGPSSLVTPSSRWLVYSTTPANNTLGGLNPDFSNYSCTYGGACAALSTNNGLLYSAAIGGSSASAPVNSQLPDTVQYMSLGGYLRDLQGYTRNDQSDDYSALSADQKEKTEGNDLIEFSYGDELSSIYEKKFTEVADIVFHPKLKEFLSNPFAMLMD